MNFYKKTGEDRDGKSLVSTEVSVAKESSDESSEVDCASKGIDDCCSCDTLHVEDRS